MTAGAASTRRRDVLGSLLAAAPVALAGAVLLAGPALAEASASVPPSDLLEVEELLGVQTLLLGLVASSALRVTGALGRGRTADANAPPAEFTKTGARRAAVNITPRGGAAGGVLLEQLFAAKVRVGGATRAFGLAERAGRARAISVRLQLPTGAERATAQRGPRPPSRAHGASVPAISSERWHTRTPRA